MPNSKANLTATDEEVLEYMRRNVILDMAGMLKVATAIHALRHFVNAGFSDSQAVQYMLTKPRWMRLANQVYQERVQNGLH